MSYSALIQKDSPACFWSLDETAGTTVYSDKYLSQRSGAGQAPSTIYNGTYSSTITANGNVQSVSVPIVYGGKSSIKLSSVGTISIPSLNKMSLMDCGNPSSIEFWIKVDTTYNSEQVFLYKGNINNPEVKISLFNDYIIYTIGTLTKKQSVAAHIDSINKPIHIVASYSKSQISLTVNGVRSSEELENYKDYFDVQYTSSPFIFKKPTNINNFQIDSIALYSYVLTREQALRHFMYGCGYNIPTEFIDKNNGVYYNFSMQDHQYLKAYDYGGAKPWSITNSNNCLITDNRLTIKKYSEPSLYFAENYNTQQQKEILFKEDNYLSFNNLSYLMIDNPSSIIPVINGGWAFKFNKTGITLNSQLGEQPLFSLFCNDSSEELSFTINTSSIKAYYNKDESVDAPVLISTINYGTLPDDFYVGFYIKDINTVDIFYLSSSNNIVNTYTAQSNIVFNSPSIRVGSTNYWVSNNTDTTRFLQDNKYTQLKLSKIVAVHKDNLSYYSTFANIEGSSFNHYYTVSPNYYEKRFNIKSFSTAEINIPLSSLINSTISNYTGACRLEIGNPLISDTQVIGNVQVKCSGSKFVAGNILSTFLAEQTITDRVITSGTWLNGSNLISPTTSVDASEVLKFKFILKTDDLYKTPPIVDYFRLFSYPVTEETISNVTYKYLSCNSSPGGNPAKIYYNSLFAEYAVPDIAEYPFFYNGYANGLKIENSYAKITQDYSFPPKMQTVISATKNSGSTSATFTVENNLFVSGDYVYVSDVYNDNGTINTQWNFSSSPRQITSISGNNITISGYYSQDTFTYPTNSDYFGTITKASGVQTLSFMMYLPSTTPTTINDPVVNIVKVGATQIHSRSLNTSSVTIYINNVALASGYDIANTIKKDRWNHILISFPTPKYVHPLAPIDILIGSQSTTGKFYIDQFMIFDKLSTTSFRTNLYNLIVGKNSFQINDALISISDTDSTKATTEEVLVTNIIDSIDNVDDPVSLYWYNELFTNQEQTKSITLNYEPVTVSETTLIQGITNGNQLKVSSVANLIKNTSGSSNDGSFLDLVNNEDVDENYIVDINSFYKKTIITEKIDAKTNPVSTLKIKVSDVSGIEKGQLVTIKNNSNVPNNAHVTNISGLYITIYFGPATKTKQINKGTAIEFRNTYSTITLQNPVTAQKGDKLIFKNDTSWLNESKLLLETGYLQNGDYFLVSNNLLDENSQKYLYQVTSDIEEGYDNNTRSKVITLSQDSEFGPSTYNNYIFTTAISDFYQPSYKKSGLAFTQYQLFSKNKVSASIVKEK